MRFGVPKFGIRKDVIASGERFAMLHRSRCTVLLILSLQKEEFVVKLRLRENESVNDAVKRFRKLVEHAGIKKEMRRREYYEKPSDQHRRARRRAERRARITRLSGT